ASPFAYVKIGFKIKAPTCAYVLTNADAMRLKSRKIADGKMASSPLSRDNAGDRTLTTRTAMPTKSTTFAVCAGYPNVSSATPTAISTPDTASQNVQNTQSGFPPAMRVSLQHRNAQTIP